MGSHPGRGGFLLRAERRRLRLAPSTEGEVRLRRWVAMMVLVAWPAIASASGDKVGLETITGTTIEGGVVCPLLKLDDGEIVPLTGVPLDAYPPGERLVLEGRFVRVSICQQGRRTFEVSRNLTN
jgi:hypothetical protein